MLFCIWAIFDVLFFLIDFGVLTNGNCRCGHSALLVFFTNAYFPFSCDFLEHWRVYGSHSPYIGQHMRNYVSYGPCMGQQRKKLKNRKNPIQHVVKKSQIQKWPNIHFPHIPKCPNRIFFPRNVWITEIDNSCPRAKQRKHWGLCVCWGSQQHASL